MSSLTAEAEHTHWHLRFDMSVSEDGVAVDDAASRYGRTERGLETAWVEH